MQGTLHLLHYIPGRMRIKLTGAVGIEGITGGLKKRRGFEDLSFSPVTGNILVKYDPAILTDQQVISLIGNLSHIYSDSAANEKAAEVLSDYKAGKPAGKENLKTTIINGVRRADSEVRRWTGGQADLKLLFPVGVFLWALFLFMSGGQWMHPSYYSLMIAAFSVFMVLNLS